MQSTNSHLGRLHALFRLVSLFFIGVTFSNRVAEILPDAPSYESRVIILFWTASRSDQALLHPLKSTFRCCFEVRVGCKTKREKRLAGPQTQIDRDDDSISTHARQGTGTRAASICSSSPSPEVGFEGLARSPRIFPFSGFLSLSLVRPTNLIPHQVYKLPASLTTPISVLVSPCCW